MIQELKPDLHFTPCPIRDDDELFPNGIFEFNITKIMEHLDKNPPDVELVEVAVGDLDQGYSSLDESHVQSVDITRPVVLAEISPGQYNLIDGHHRVEKALRQGLNTIRAYKWTARQHVGFLTSKKAYLAYVEYWNAKVERSRRTGTAQPP